MQGRQHYEVGVLILYHKPKKNSYLCSTYINSIRPCLTNLQPTTVFPPTNPSELIAIFSAALGKQNEFAHSPLGWARGPRQAWRRGARQVRRAVDVGLEFSLPFFQEKGRRNLAGSRKSCNFAVSLAGKQGRP